MMEAQAQEQLKQQSTKHFWNKIPLLPGLFWRKKVPVVLQMSAVECGSACLTMILRYYGCQTTLAEVRNRCEIGRDGLSARSIMRIAQDYGLRARAVSVQNNYFRFVRLPAIVHWEFDHFLIVERWSARYVDLVDPAMGRRRVTIDEFETSFTGVAIILEPGARFIRYHTLSQGNLYGYMKNYARQAPWTLVQILIASLLLQIFGLSVPVLTKVVVDHVLPAHTQSVVLLIGIGIIVLSLSQLVATLLRAGLLVYLQARVDMYMMLSFFEHLLTLPLRFFQRHASGDIIARLNSNITIRDTLSNQLVSTILDGSFVLIYLVILFWQSRLFGLCVLIIGVFQIVLLLCMDRPLRELGMRELTAQGRAQGYVTEALVGIVSLKAAGAEQRALQHWSNLFFHQLNTSIRRNMLSSLMDTLMVLLQTFSPLAFLWIGMLQVLNGTLQVGTMLALNALAASFLVPLSSLVRSGQKLQLVRSHLERLSDILEAEPEQNIQLVNQPPALKGQIVLDNVCFRYTAQSPDTLKKISLTIEPGQKVAIVGRTGSGKSTLGKLLLGLYTPTEGEIYYDGLPLKSLNYEAVRAQFGVVMQEAAIFSGTIRQNIAFNNPDINMETIVHAAQLAALHSDIENMPMRYETFISEQGSALSGGQRQRIALARAIAHSPVLLLLDEATSSLDVLTEQLVEQNIRTLNSTQIIIAHRLSTIRNADSILVLDNGVVVERGTHEELLQRNGHYARLVQSQSVQQEAEVRDLK